jgi:hypothetical protein
MKLLTVMTLVFFSAQTWSSVDKVTHELTLLNIGSTISKTLKSYHHACDAVVDQFGNKVFNNQIINEPKPIVINQIKRQPTNEIKPIHIIGIKKQPTNEIKPIHIGLPKSISNSQLINCHQYRKDLASSLLTRTRNIIETQNLNINEFNEVMDFVDQLVSNMLTEDQNEQLLAEILSTKKLYSGLELVELIVDNGLVPPANMFKVNAFMKTFDSTLQK